MRQEVTRAHKGWALDSVTIHNEVLRQTKEEILAPPVVGARGNDREGAGAGLQAPILSEADLCAPVQSAGCWASPAPGDLVSEPPVCWSGVHDSAGNSPDCISLSWQVALCLLERMSPRARPAADQCQGRGD